MTPPLRRLVLGLLLASGTARGADEAWKRYDERDGVTSYSRSLADSRLLAMRGVATVDAPLGKLLGVYLDAKKATSWVNLLVQLDEKPIAGTLDAIERQIYDMPWPVADREFVFKREVTVNAQAKTVKVVYTSVEDARFPVTEDYVRAHDHGSGFTFTLGPDGKTTIEAVAQVDPKGSLPAWLFNSVQRSWPRESIGALVKAAAAPDVVSHPSVAGW